MWHFLQNKAGELNFDFRGQRLYINADNVGQVAPREKAVQKLVRAIIEANWGDGKELKKSGRLYANYHSRLRYLGCGEGGRVAG